VSRLAGPVGKAPTTSSASATPLLGGDSRASQRLTTQLDVNQLIGRQLTTRPGAPPAPGSPRVTSARKGRLPGRISLPAQPRRAGISARSHAYPLRRERPCRASGWPPLQPPNGSLSRSRQPAAVPCGLELGAGKDGPIGQVDREEPLQTFRGPACVVCGPCGDIVQEPVRQQR